MDLESNTSNIATYQREYVTDVLTGCCLGLKEQNNQLFGYCRLLIWVIQLCILIIRFMIFDLFNIFHTVNKSYSQSVQLTGGSACSAKGHQSPFTDLAQLMIILSCCLSHDFCYKKEGWQSNGFMRILKSEFAENTKLRRVFFCEVSTAN